MLVSDTYASKVAHGLEEDEVVLPGVQRAVPVAIVGVVVPHSKGCSLGQAARGKFGCIVVWSSTGLSLTVRCGNGEAVLNTQFSLHLPTSFLLHDHLICAVDTIKIY